MFRFCVEPLVPPRQRSRTERRRCPLFQQEGLSSDGASGTSVREGRARGQQSGSVSGVPGSLLEIQVPGSLTRSAESETLGAGLNDLYVSQFRQ